jgi:DNA-binding NarL/FixJ family response regulator
MRVVLAESDERVRRSLSLHLRRTDHEVLEAEAGEKAFETVRQHDPNIVLLDPMMMKAGGAPVLEELSAWYPELPIVAILKDAGVQEAMETIRKGAWDVIRGSIEDLPPLTEAMDHVMKMREMRCRAKEERLRIDKEAAELRVMWESTRQALAEKTIALREVLNTIDMERQDCQRRIMSQVETAVLPVLERAMGESPSGVRAMLEEVKKNLQDITSPFVEHLGRRCSVLTPREVRICQMIRRGKSSKDMAKAEGTAKETIDGHRKSIRRKLGIANMHVNLAAFLQTLEEAAPGGGQGDGRIRH